MLLNEKLRLEAANVPTLPLFKYWVLFAIKWGVPQTMILRKLEVHDGLLKPEVRKQ